MNKIWLMILLVCTLFFSGCGNNKEKMVAEQESTLQEQERTERTTQQQTTEYKSTEQKPTEQQSSEQTTVDAEPLISQLMDKSTFKPNGKTPQLLG